MGGAPRWRALPEDFAEVADPVADKRLQQVLLAALQSDQTRPAGAAAYFFQTAPPKHSDPSVSQARGSSPIDCLIKTVAALRATLLRVLPGPTPRGEVKLALSDDPDPTGCLLSIGYLDGHRRSRRDPAVGDGLDHLRDKAEVR